MVFGKDNDFYNNCDKRAAIVAYNPGVADYLHCYITTSCRASEAQLISL